MRKQLVVLALAAACGSQSKQTDPLGPRLGEPTGAKPVPPARTTPRYDARTFFDTVSMGGASFSHDGARILVSSDKTGVFNVYAQPVAGGDPSALTTSDKESNFAVSWFPNDDRYLYSADAGGNEITHLWVVEKDGTAKDLTPGDKVKAGFAGWSKDKKAFYVLTNERDPKAFDLYKYSVDGYGRELLYQNDANLQIGDVSPDERWIALTKVVNNADSDVYLFDRQAKAPPAKKEKKKAKKAKKDEKPAPPPGVEPLLITRHKGMVQNRVIGFTPDGTRLLYSTDGAGEFTQAWSYDLATKKHNLEAESAWDVMAVYFSENGKYRVVATNEDARTRLEITDTTTGQAVVPKDLPPGDITGATFDLAEKQMAFYLSSDRTPADLYVMDLASGATKRLSNNLNPKVNPEHLVDGTVVRYKSFDDLEIPALLFKPRDASKANRVPAVVYVHGGPGGQSRLGYNPQIQLLANAGYAVLAVNNRGSSGYGKTFYHLDDRKHGDVDLKDCIWGRKYLETLDWVDGRRVAIMGGSYGGYMVAAALAFQPDAFDAGIDIFGVTNWLRTLESIPPWWASMKDMLYAEMGDPATDKERLHAISPLFHAKNIKKPLLVVQGANDPRVLKVESDELVEAVKANGVPVEYLVFEDEGHGFLKKENRIAALDKIIAFLDKYLANK